VTNVASPHRHEKQRRREAYHGADVFDSYQIVRMNEAPTIDVLLDRDFNISNHD